MSNNEMPEPHIVVEINHINFNRFYVKIKDKNIFAECRRFGGLMGLIKRNPWHIKYYGAIDLIYLQNTNLPKNKLLAAAQAGVNLIRLYSKKLNPDIR